MAKQSDAERDILAADIAAVMRQLYRLRTTAQKASVWAELEAAGGHLARACGTLTRAKHGCRR